MASNPFSRITDSYLGRGTFGATASPLPLPRPTAPNPFSAITDAYIGGAPAAPSLGQRAIEGFEMLTYPLTLPKRGIDYLARTSARAMGVPVGEEATTGSMLRAGLGLAPGQEADQGPEGYARRLGGRAIEFAGDIATDPLTWALGGAGKVAGAGRRAAAFVGPRALEPSIQAAKAIEAGRRAEQVGRGAAAAFAPSMAAGALHEGAEAARLYREQGLSPETAEAGLGTALTGGMAALSARHALTRPKAPVVELPTEESAAEGARRRVELQDVADREMLERLWAAKEAAAQQPPDVWRGPEVQVGGEIPLRTAPEVMADQLRVQGFPDVFPGPEAMGLPEVVRRRAIEEYVPEEFGIEPPPVPARPPATFFPEVEPGPPPEPVPRRAPAGEPPPPIYDPTQDILTAGAPRLTGEPTPVAIPPEAARLSPRAIEAARAEGATGQPIPRPTVEELVERRLVENARRAATRTAPERRQEAELRAPVEQGPAPAPAAAPAAPPPVAPRRLAYRRLEDVPRDEQGNRILPGEESWAPAERAAVDAEAVRLAKDLREAEVLQRTEEEALYQEASEAAGMGRPPDFEAVAYRLREQGRTDPRMERALERAKKRGGVGAPADYREGHPLGDLPYPPRQMVKALKDDKGNVVELAIRERTRDEIAREAVRFEPEAIEAGRGMAGGEPMLDPDAFATRRAPEGQRGLPGIGEDVERRAPVVPRRPGLSNLEAFEAAMVKKYGRRNWTSAAGRKDLAEYDRIQAAAQPSMFGGELLQGVEKKVPEGREQAGPLFQQEAEAQRRTDAARQTTLEPAAPEEGRRVKISRESAERIREGGFKVAESEVEPIGTLLERIPGEEGTAVDITSGAKGYHVTIMDTDVGRGLSTKVYPYKRYTLEQVKAQVRAELEQRGGQAPAFATVPETGAVEAAPAVDAAMVRRAFATGKIFEVDENVWRVELPGGREITVRVVSDGIEYSTEAFQAARGRGLEPGETVIGGWTPLDRGGIVWLSKEASQETVHHEAFHAAMDLALAPAERNAVLKRYGTEEAAAEAYGKWEPRTPNSLFGKILSFFRNIYRSFKPSWESAFERTRTGEAYGGPPHGRAGVEQFATKERPWYAKEPGRPATRPLHQVLASGLDDGRKPPPGTRLAPNIGTIELTDGSRFNVMGEMFAKAGADIQTLDGTIVDPGTIRRVLNRYGEEVWNKSSPTAFATAPAEAPVTTVSGERVRPGETPRVEQRVEKLREAEAQAGAAPAHLDRETKRGWKDIEPEVQEVIRTRTDSEWWFNTFKRRGFQDAEVQALDAVTRGKYELKEDALAAYQAAIGTDGQQAAFRRYAEAQAEYQPFERMAVNDGSGAARALAARGRIMEAAKVPNRAFMRKVLREIKGVSDAQSGELQRLFETGDPTFTSALRAALAGKLDKWTYLYKSGLVQAPGTHFANNAGNAMVLGVEVTDRAAAAGVDWALSKLSRGPRERRLEEVGAEVGAMLQSAPNALKGYIDDLKGLVSRVKTGKEPPIRFDVELARQVSPWGGYGGRVVDIPLRALGVADQRWKEPGGAGEMAALATRIARVELGERASRADVADKMQEIIRTALSDDPGPYVGLLKASAEARQRRTFQDKPWDIVGSLNQMRSRHPWLHFVFPFTTTPGNIARYAVRHTPVGFLPGGEAWKATADFRAGKISKGQAADIIAPRIVGTLMLGSAIAATKLGTITGSGPVDPRERNTLRETGWQPYSVVVPVGAGVKVYIPFNRFEPVSSVLGIAADMAEIHDEKKAGDMFEKGLGSIVANYTSKSYLQGWGDAANAIARPREFLGQYARNFIRGWVPNLIGKTAEAIDPLYRDTSSSDPGALGIAEKIAKSVIARIPGASYALAPRRGASGEPVERPGTAATRLLLPVQPTKTRPGKELEAELVRIGYVPSQPKREVTISGRKVRLDQDEYTLIQDAYRDAAEDLRREMRSGQWGRLADTIDEGGQRSKEALARRIYDRYRDRARERVYRRPSFQRRLRERRPSA